jgi:hypothetical protein
MNCDIDWKLGWDAHIQGIHFKYSNYGELCQGGPRVGFLNINDYIPGIVCCGPFIYTDSYLYIAVKASRSIYFSEKGDFRVCRLHILDNCRREYMGIPRNYIELVSISNNRLFYYDTIKREKTQYLDLNYLIKSSETDTPLHFNPIIITNDFTIEYINLEKKTSTNFPVGNLRVNEFSFAKHKFGGPFLYNETFIIVPVFKQKIWGAGFNMARIDLLNYHIHIFPCFKRMVFLEKFMNDTVYYYDTIDKTSLRNYSI